MCKLLEVGGLAMSEALFRVEGWEADWVNCEGIGVSFRGVEGIAHVVEECCTPVPVQRL